LLQNAAHIAHDVGIGEPHDTPPFRCHKFCSSLIGGCKKAVGIAVNLDLQHGGAAWEIGDERADNGLPSEFEAGKAFGTQLIPLGGFGRRGVRAHLFGVTKRFSIPQRLMAPSP
jgi:hypothetical protein